MFTELFRDIGVAADAALWVGVGLRVTASRPVGTVHLLDGPWRALEIDTALRKVLGSRRFTTNVERVLFALVANRAWRRRRSWPRVRGGRGVPAVGSRMCCYRLGCCCGGRIWGGHCRSCGGGPVRGAHGAAAAVGVRGVRGSVAGTGLASWCDQHERTLTSGGLVDAFTFEIDL